MSTYSRASKAVWFEDRFLGSLMKPNVVVIHTTEGTSLPSYSGGAVAPNYTAVPDFKAKRLKFYAHFSDERSARALRNEAGGVQTNTLNCIQIELVGTCSPSTSQSWKTRHILWSNPPAWALRDLAHFAADMHKRHGVKLEGPAPVWTPYPESFGPGGQRFSFHQWSNFYGFCGHQHVPENVHGDPGAFPWGAVQKLAQALVDNKVSAPSAPKQSPFWDALYERARVKRAKLPKKSRARRASLTAIMANAAKWSVRH
jgi:hypothetical protein